MWTGRRNYDDAKLLLEAVEGTRVRIGGDLRYALKVEERWEAEELQAQLDVDDLITWSLMEAEAYESEGSDYGCG